jgi:hypothetical protein
VAREDVEVSIVVQHGDLRAKRDHGNEAVGQGSHGLARLP